MALIVEDGNGLINAEAYCSEAYADNYHDKRGNTAWASIANKEAALIKATDYMEQVYRTRWNGLRKTTTQALSWPRLWAPNTDSNDALLTYYSSTIVPTLISNACAELALKTANGELLADQEQAVISESVGPISVTYDKSSTQRKRYVAIDSLLAPLLMTSSNAMKVIRT
jgi:hypothetical protein